LEWLWMVYYSLKYKVFLCPILPLFSKTIKNILNKTFAGIIGSSVTQINIWINMVLASFVNQGISYLYYADRIVQLPLALIATSATTVLLPTLSSEISTKSTHVNKSQSDIIRIILFFIIPSAFTLYFFNFEIVEFLFQRGAFNEESSIKTSQALRILAIALPAYALIKMFNNIFYANKNTKTPVKIAFLTLILHAILGVFLLTKMQHIGIATASAISSWFNTLILFFLLLQGKKLFININKLCKDLAIFILCSFILIFITQYMLSVIHCHILISLAAGGFFYCICAITWIKTQIRKNN
ncbi:MAG: polysaccharide biosynthesis C-terminal domain-containing protein, partial [Proteobacteria bacterium]|nr:polysaccharide biosynthesis C-terminal domain-containing protein [Pseudomonadota bacterium]